MKISDRKSDDHAKPTGNVTLVLSETEAEILGFALTRAWRDQVDRANALSKRGRVQSSRDYLDRAMRIENLRAKLDRA